MTYIAAALQILRSSRQPLTTREITERALAEGLITTRGKTPVQTMAAALYERLSTDGQLIKTEDRGTIRAKPGTVRWALRKTPTRAR